MKNTAEGSSSIPLGLAKETISACTCILVTFILKWEKKTSWHLEIISFIYPKDPKNMKRDEN